MVPSRVVSAQSQPGRRGAAQGDGGPSHPDGRSGAVRECAPAARGIARRLGLGLARPACARPPPRRAHAAAHTRVHVCQRDLAGGRVRTHLIDGRGPECVRPALAPVRPRGSALPRHVCPARPVGTGPDGSARLGRGQRRRRVPDHRVGQHVLSQRGGLHPDHPRAACGSRADPGPGCPGRDRPDAGTL